MCILRRFPVSDEFISYRQTLDSVCDRMDFFEFSSSHFSRKWKLFGESMEMSEMAWRIEWKRSRVLAGPPSGRNPLVNCGLDTSAPFFRVSGNLKNGRCQKNVGNAARTFSERMEPVRGQSVAWRSRYVRKTSRSSAKSSRGADFLSWISHFRLCSFWTVGTPDVHRATRNDGPG